MDANATKALATTEALRATLAPKQLALLKSACEAVADLPEDAPLPEQRGEVYKGGYKTWTAEYRNGKGFTSAAAGFATRRAAFAWIQGQWDREWA